MEAGYLSRVGNKLRRRISGFPRSFNFHKKELIDYTYRRCHPTPASFADLGGVWGVDGAYTFYTLHKYRTKCAFLVDTDFTDAVIKKSRSANNLSLIKCNFGEDSMLEKFGPVDAIFLFDVLLHQVAPDWNQILENYSKRTKYFIVYNQQWTASERTVRLLDLGREAYFENTPHDEADPTYMTLFDKMHEIHPQHQRIWRDIHNVWQWGITDHDLLDCMEKLGFEMKYYKNCGRFGFLSHFENHAFVFQKT
jgi:hypothetical protein